MTHINRQRYMAELSKLLSFMFKEDRDEIIQHYNQLLDNAEDEQALLEEFGSPTKLAVTISRSYDRELRKLAVKADSKAKATAPETFTNIAPAKESSEPEYLPEEEPVEEAEEEDCENIVGQILKITGINSVTVAGEEAAAEEETPAGAEETSEEAPAEAEEAPTEETAEEAPVEAEEAPAEEAEEEKADVKEEAPAEETVSEETKVIPAVEIPAAEETSAEEPTVKEEAPAEEAVAETQEKIRPFALIVYLIFAIPIGLVLFAVLAAVTLSLLAVGLCVGGVGISILSLAFSGMQLLADTLIILGAALVVLALALVLVWFAVWLIIISFRGLFRGIIGLGRKLCVKEVAVNG